MSLQTSNISLTLQLLHNRQFCRGARTMTSCKETFPQDFLENLKRSFQNFQKPLKKCFLLLYVSSNRVGYYPLLRITLLNFLTTNSYIVVYWFVLFLISVRKKCVNLTWRMYGMLCIYHGKQWFYCTGFPIDKECLIYFSRHLPISRQL